MERLKLFSQDIRCIPKTTTIRYAVALAECVKTMRRIAPSSLLTSLVFEFVASGSFQCTFDFKDSFFIEASLDVLKCQCPSTPEIHIYKYFDLRKRPWYYTSFVIFVIHVLYQIRTERELLAVVESDVMTLVRIWILLGVDVRKLNCMLRMDRNVLMGFSLRQEAAFQRLSRLSVNKDQHAAFCGHVYQFANAIQCGDMTFFLKSELLKHSYVYSVEVPRVCCFGDRRTSGGGRVTPIRPLLINRVSCAPFHIYTRYGKTLRKQFKLTVVQIRRRVDNLLSKILSDQSAPPLELVEEECRRPIEEIEKKCEPRRNAYVDDLYEIPGATDRQCIPDECGILSREALSQSLKQMEKLNAEYREELLENYTNRVMLDLHCEILTAIENHTDTH